jgi:uncharacterized protein (DUF58 family)
MNQARASSSTDRKGPAQPGLQPAQVVRQARRLHFRVEPRVVSQLAGAYLGSRPGTGLAFSELRAYEPGDDVRHIDWNVTARHGRPFVRHYIEERALELALVVDVSASMRFGPAGRGKADRAAQAAALLASAAIENQDLASLILVSDRIEHELPPAGGARHLAILLRSLVTSPSNSRATALPVAAERLLVRSGRSLIVLISDFLEPGPPLLWRRLARRHRLVMMRIQDPREIELPRAGKLEVQDPETGQACLLDSSRESDRRAYRSWVEKRTRHFHRWCVETGAESLDLSTATDPLRPLLAFFRARRRHRSRRR